MLPVPPIRPIAIAVIRRGAELLAFSVENAAGAIVGWRPLGGGIEPGERAVEAVQREIMEELGLALTEPRLLAVIENIFEHRGVPGHEIVFAFEAAFADAEAYRREAFTFTDGAADEMCHSRWIDIASFRAGTQQLFPAELLNSL